MTSRVDQNQLPGPSQPGRSSAVFPGTRQLVQQIVQGAVLTIPGRDGEDGQNSYIPGPQGLAGNNAPIIPGRDGEDGDSPFPLPVSPGYPVNNGLSVQSISTAYTTKATDANTALFHPSSDVTARTWTIDSNANVPQTVGTSISFINQNGAGVITIAITADTMRLAGAGTTGNRTLAANGIATAVKIAATEWIINGTGLT